MCRYIQSPPISLQSAAFTINTAPCAEIVSLCEDASLCRIFTAVGRWFHREVLCAYECMSDNPCVRSVYDVAASQSGREKNKVHPTVVEERIRTRVRYRYFLIVNAHRRSDSIYGAVWRKAGMLIQDQGCFPSHEHQRRAVYTHARAGTYAGTCRVANTKILSVCNTRGHRRSLRRCVHAFGLDVINSREAPCLECWKAQKRLFLGCIYQTTR